MQQKISSEDLEYLRQLMLDTAAARRAGAIGVAALAPVLVGTVWYYTGFIQGRANLPLIVATGVVTLVLSAYMHFQSEKLAPIGRRLLGAAQGEVPRVVWIYERVIHSSGGLLRASTVELRFSDGSGITVTPHLEGHAVGRLARIFPAPVVEGYHSEIHKLYARDPTLSDTGAIRLALAQH